MPAFVTVVSVAATICIIGRAAIWLVSDPFDTEFWRRIFDVAGRVVFGKGWREL